MVIPYVTCTVSGKLSFAYNRPFRLDPKVHCNEVSPYGSEHMIQTSLSHSAHPSPHDSCPQPLVAGGQWQQREYISLDLSISGDTSDSSMQSI